MADKRGNVLGEVPNQASELLPWLVNDTLDADEAAIVAQHLQHSPSVREEFELVELIAESVRAHQGSNLQPSAEQFNAVMARIGAQDEHRGGLLGRLVRRLWNPRGFTTLRGVWMIGVHACAVVLLATLVLSDVRPTTDTGVYEILVAEPTGARVERQVKVIFTPAATVADMQSAVESVKGTVVAGPSALGVFTIVIPDGVTLDDARALLVDSPATELVKTQLLRSSP